MALGLHSEASNFCVKGLELDPKNDELKKIRDKMQKQLAEEDARSKRVLEKKHRAEVLQHLKIFSNVNPALSLKSGKDLRTA